MSQKVTRKTCYYFECSEPYQIPGGRDTRCNIGSVLFGTRAEIDRRVAEHNREQHKERH